MFDREGNKTIFSRDCLEIEVFLPNGQPLFVLCNHFKSRGYDMDGTADEKRQRQARRVSTILEKYDLTTDWIVVAGDFNDTPDRPPLQPLLNTQNLSDVLALQFPNHPQKRWTYHYDGFNQIDYLLVSNPLKEHFLRAGVERRGIYNLKKLTTASNGAVDLEQEYDTVTHWTNAASDHGAVWADFTLP
jgi:endonuclease/exonuclease/phosphatase family metal-dependent hydrolase